MAVPIPVAHPRGHSAVVVDATWRNVERLHAAHVVAAQAADAPLDLAAVLRATTQAGRVRFAPANRIGGSSSLGADRLDAIVHAAEHGYLLCADAHVFDGLCWLPAGHAGKHMHGASFHWSLAYGQPLSGVRIACTTCQPHSWAPAPADCPHLGALRDEHLAALGIA